MKLGKLFLIPMATALVGAQTPNPTLQQTETTKNTRSDTVPIYRVNVIGQSTTAINYGHRKGETKIGFRGTVLMPNAKGEAKVESRKGAMQIDAEFERMEAPARFGRQFLTYVLWAITPEGRASNLGEIVTDASNKGVLRAATELQTFALIVTAEPYYAVTQPSDVVVLENFVKDGKVAGTELVKARYELLKRGEYNYRTDGASFTPTTREVSNEEYEVLLQLYQARNAVALARAQGADRRAPEVFGKAEQLLQQAEREYAGDKRSKDAVNTARQASQAAEDARIIAVKRKQQETSASGAESLVRFPKER